MSELCVNVNRGVFVVVPHTVGIEFVGSNPYCKFEPVVRNHGEDNLHNIKRFNF